MYGGAVACTLIHFTDYNEDCVFLERFKNVHFYLPSQKKGIRTLDYGFVCYVLQKNLSKITLVSIVFSKKELVSLSLTNRVQGPKALIRVRNSLA